MGQENFAEGYIGEALETSKESACVVPDLSKAGPIILDLFLTKGLRSQNIKDRKGEEDKEEKLLAEKIYRKHISGGWPSEIATLAYLIFWLHSQGLKEISKLKTGGSICEIGGPSPVSTIGDLAIGQAKTVVFPNPNFFDVSQAQDFTQDFAKEKQIDIHQTPLPAEQLSALNERFKKFDFVTSYNVFGNESRDWGGFDPYLGPDLSSREKRIRILKEVAAVLKENGVFLIKTLSVAPIDYPQFGLTEEQIEKISKKMEGCNFRAHGFNFDEFAEAGFVAVSQIPFHDIFIFQRKKTL
ncbi:TPA: hypothetical protein DEA21_01605 [Candidatus Uhrbacteria bacterium]|nr:hypothetical protein [Candidatus Uhrbacteria bacterium]HCU31308.1 hypothetical protein [Candidatus Uhrbacteria bacterium]